MPSEAILFSTRLDSYELLVSQWVKPAGVQSFVDNSTMEVQGLSLDKLRNITEATLVGYLAKKCQISQLTSVAQNQNITRQEGSQRKQMTECGTQKRLQKLLCHSLSVNVTLTLLILASETTECTKINDTSYTYNLSNLWVREKESTNFRRKMCRWRRKKECDESARRKYELLNNIC